jgi:EPS-associated MarR family transcriptional regulator
MMPLRWVMQTLSLQPDRSTLTASAWRLQSVMNTGAMSLPWNGSPVPTCNKALCRPAAEGLRELGRISWALSLPGTYQTATVLRVERLDQPWGSRDPVLPMASKHPQDVEDLHFRVLKLLQDQPDLSQRELAERVGVSNGKLHYCMRALIDKGLIKLGNFANSKHHLGYAYLLTPAGIAQKAGMTSRFLKRKLAEYEMLKKEIELLQVEAQTQPPSNEERNRNP